MHFFKSPNPFQWIMLVRWFIAFDQFKVYINIKKTWRQDELNFNSKSNSNCNSDYEANDNSEENPDIIWALIGNANIKCWKDE